MSEKIYTLKLNARDIDIIGRGVVKLPLEEAMPTYQKIGDQVQAQNVEPVVETAQDQNQDTPTPVRRASRSK